MSLVRVALFIGLLALLVRVPAVADFMTVDEQTWLIRSGDFMKNLRRGNIEGTFQGTHPGATAMWLMGSGVALQEWRLGVTLDSENLILFHKAAVMPLVLANSFLIAVITGLLVLLVGWPSALVAGLLVAVEPYLVGMSQIAHLDGLQSFLMLTALLAFACYLKFSERYFVYVTGLAVGLAFGTKLLLALWLVPSFVGMILLTAYWERNVNLLWRYAKVVAGIVLIALIVLVLIWPTVLTKADFQLGYISRDTATIVTDEHGVYEAAENPIDSRTFYLRTALGRVTPYVQVLIVASSLYLVGSIFRRRRRPATSYQIPATYHQLLIWLSLYALGYLFFISLAAKKADRYALPGLAAGPLLAGLLLAEVWPTIERRLPLAHRWRKSLFVLGGLALISMAFLWSPYTIAYSNPFFPNVRPLTQQGWGEGLDQAAAWLNERPGAKQMYIASWYPSVMRTYFNGRTMSLSSRDDYRVQYVVTYRNMGGRAPDDQGSDVLDEFKGKEPVHTIFIQGLPYVWIYETRSVGNYTKHVGEITGSKNVGQTIQPKAETWNALDLGFATFSSRANTKDVVVHIRQSPQASEDLRTVKVNAADIVDNEWQRFTFEPLSVSDGQEFYIFIDSPTSVAGNAVTVRYTDLDISAGTMYLNGQPKPGDIAYRIPD